MGSSTILNTVMSSQVDTQARLTKYMGLCMCGSLHVKDTSESYEADRILICLCKPPATVNHFILSKDGICPHRLATPVT